MVLVKHNVKDEHGFQLLCYFVLAVLVFQRQPSNSFSSFFFLLVYCYALFRLPCRPVCRMCGYSGTDYFKIMHCFLESEFTPISVQAHVKNVSHMQTAKAQASLRIWTVSPETHNMWSHVVQGSIRQRDQSSGATEWLRMCISNKNKSIYSEIPFFQIGSILALNMLKLAIS